MSDFLFRGDLSQLDPRLSELTLVEAERQYRKLILIPSESAAPMAVREALASAFQNIYAEGYPPDETRWMSEDEIFDLETRLAAYRRYSDPRYYKGVEYVDTVEALTRRRCAEAFATPDVSADEIFVNVQALSGGPANNAVYHAIVEPGDVVMGMDLLHGGHLSHGSPANRSGKYYQIVHYTVDPKTERIDYDTVKALALQHKPKMIIAGYSSYPWATDWAKWREIADACGAYLLADIAHVAGLVAAGVYPSPVGYADVVTFTTHKSLCGPRGAVILTTSHRLSRLIDRAVFPGEQGGPHINTMVGQALAFKLATTDQFKALQKQIVDNCVALSAALEDAGLRISFGGTDTHLTNIDCRSVTAEDGATLSGDMAARILDVAGIVVNRNTIPGDVSAANPSGIRIGTPWITQRGFKQKDCQELASIMADLLKGCVPYALAGRRRPLLRAKIDFVLLNDCKIRVRDLAQRMGIDEQVPSSGYPHFYYRDDPNPKAPYAVLRLSGREAEGLLLWVTGARPGTLSPGASVQTLLHTPSRSIECVLGRRKEPAEWTLTLPSPDATLALTWLRDLSDGYVTVDPDDVHKKLPGPVVVTLQGEADSLPKADPDSKGADKAWFVGIAKGKGEALPKFEFPPPEAGEPRRTALHAVHNELGAKMVPFAGWDMPVWYTSVLEEHLATRQAAGLFDVSHMGVYQVEGKAASAFLDCLVTNDVDALEIGESHYTQFLDPDGAVIDDLMVYRRSQDVYLLVVNAANDDKDWAWLTAVHGGKVRVDNQRPWAKVNGRQCQLRNLRDPTEGKDMRVDIALQGPKSREILLELGCDEDTAERLKALPWTGVMEGKFGKFNLVVSRTGYTGERVAFELFVQPDMSVALWKALLKAGEPLGLKPVGLGARDSLRTEAGLPLYGHEMAGDLGLGVGEAGFAAYVKTYKPWFIGRTAYLKQEAERKGEVVRFRFNEKGVRMAHNGDPVVDRRGRVIGVVTSCAVDSDGYLLGQAHVLRTHTAMGTAIGVFQSAAEKAGKAPSDLRIGDRISIPTPATVLSRFPR